MPDTYIKTMNDKDGNIIAPRTHAQAVQMDDGQYNLQETVESKISNNVGATGANSVAIGTNTTAIGDDGFSAGNASAATGDRATSLNEGTIAQGWAQTAVGRWNIAQGDSNTFVNTDQAFILGNGTSDAARSNALTIDWRGNVAAAGDISSGGLSLPRKNWIINGGFDVWQRGTSTSSADVYLADRWINYVASPYARSVSRQAFTVGQTDVPNNPTYFHRTVITDGGTNTSYTRTSQRIEDVAKLAGKTVSLSFWAKADGNRSIVFELRQRFGTGGSAYVSGIGLQKLNLTTSWQRFTKTLEIPSVSGKTIGNDNNTELVFWLSAGSDYNQQNDSLGNQSGTFDIANVSLVKGSVPVEWQTEAYADVLRDCQRYYIRFKADSLYAYFANGRGSSANGVDCSFQFPVDMRIMPTSIETSAMNTFSLNIGNTGVQDVSSITIITAVSSSKIALVSFIKSGAFTVAGFYQVFSNNTTSAYIGFNAEL